MSVSPDEKRKLFEQRNLIRERGFLEGIAQRYLRFIDDLVVNGENIQELRKYFPKEEVNIDLDKVKVWLLLLRNEHSEDIPKVLSFLEPTEYGWVKKKYNFINPCLREALMCKPKYSMQDEQEVKDSFSALNKIFFDEEYGSMTLLIFNYCLASLFSSQLNQSNIPRYIQIACERNTVLYNLIREIVAICDVNTGIHEECRNDNLWSCGYEQKTIYPAQNIEKNVNLLSSIRDIPVIVEGYDNIRNYHALLREIANKPNNGKLINKRDNLFPIFLCPSIKLNFKNVVNMNWTGETISEDYFELIKDNKKMLSSLVIGLVKDFIECLFPENGTETDRNAKYLDGEYPYSSEIVKSISNIRRVYSANPQTAKNVGVLSFFFTGLIIAFKRAINVKSFQVDKEFSYKGEPNMKTTVSHLDALIKKSEKSLVEVYSRYSPAPIDSIAVDINGVDPQNAKQIIKKARRHAIEIVRCYLSFGTAISITKMKVRGERYIFDVDLLEGTRQYKIFQEAENVKIAMKLEYFKPVKDGSSIIIVASEMLLKENSLIKILDDPLFKNSKLKIPFAMGYNIMGEKAIEDLAKVRHILIGGSTGSGKSTALHSLMLSIVCKKSIDDVNLLIFDFGITYLSKFRKVPHLSHPIIYDMDVGFNVIMELKAELEKRRALYFNSPDDKSEFNKLPSIFCVIDEFHKFINYGTDKKKKKVLQEAITGLLAESRGLKMHMVLAAQDPTEEKMKCGVTNLGTVLAFKCSREHNSRVMLGESGAENLLGNGDMLFKPENGIGIRSIQGAFIDEKDIATRLEEDICSFGEGKYKFVIDESKTIYTQTKPNNEPQSNHPNLINDELLPDIIMWVLEQDKIANYRIQKEFHIGNGRTNTILELLKNQKLLEKLWGNSGWTVKPKFIKDLPETIMDILMSNGYTEIDIKNALNKRQM